MRLIVALYERDIVMTDSALEQILQGVFRFANLFAQKLQLDHSYKTGSSSIAKSHHRRQYQVLPCVVFQNQTRLEPRPFTRCDIFIDTVLYAKQKNIYHRICIEMSKWRNERHERKVGERERNHGKQVKKMDVNDVRMDVMFGRRREDRIEN
jgi:hypothetical protein